MAYCDEHKLRVGTSESNCQNIEKLEKEMNEALWPAVNARPKITTLITIAIIVFGFLGGSFSMLYSQGEKTAAKVEAQGNSMTLKIDNLADCLRQDIRRIENRQMLLDGKVQSITKFTDRQDAKDISDETEP